MTKLFFCCNVISVEFRPLKNDEKKQLINNRNRSKSWDKVFITDETDCNLISDCEMIGNIKIGALSEGVISRFDRDFSKGIHRSTLCDCEIGGECAIDSVGLARRVKTGSSVILNRVDEISCLNGFTPPVISVRNENGGRSIPLSPEMTEVEATLFSEYRDVPGWAERAKELVSPKEPFSFALIGEECSVRSSGILTDIVMEAGASCTNIPSAKNLYLCEKAVADNVISLKNGILAAGAVARDGVIAENFFLGEAAIAEKGMTLSDSYIGANSHIACGEIVATLTGPFHVQHHKSSFLIASALNGESNLAAGAIIGSNHNSRHPEGELFARRGFWPGLSVSLKHNSRFASFTIIEKGLYKRELNNPFPFALITRDEKEDCTVILPAYYLIYNLYALERGNKKFRERDNRLQKTYPIEADFLAVDTVEEILSVLSLLEGKEDSFFIEGIEKGKPVKIIKSEASLSAYREALIKFGVESLTEETDDLSSLNVYLDRLNLCKKSRRVSWRNIAGVNFLRSDTDRLVEEEAGLKGGDFLLFRKKLTKLINQSETERINQALFALSAGSGNYEWTEDLISESIRRYREIVKLWKEGKESSRRKDFTNPFVTGSYRSPGEMAAILGDLSRQK